MTLKNIHKEESSQRYNPDLLINSYAALVEALNNCYEINGKGYLLLLRIDNLSDLLASKGSEGYLAIIRDFISRVKKKHNGLENIYFFNSQTLALLFTEYGQVDIISECENIFKVSQAIVSGEGENAKEVYMFTVEGYEDLFGTGLGRGFIPGFFQFNSTVTYKEYSYTTDSDAIAAKMEGVSERLADYDSSDHQGTTYHEE